MDISKQLGLHKSTTSRLLRVLVYYDFLQHDEKTKKYRLGATIAQMGLSIQQSLDEQLVSIAQPYIDGLRNTIGESVALEVWQQHTTTLAYRAEASASRRSFLLKPGDQIDVHVSGGARVILAYSPLHIVESALKGPFPQYTPDTITDPMVIKAQLPKIREDGYYISVGQRHPDSNVITVPVFNYTNAPVAAISLFATTDRLPQLMDNDVIGHLKKSAAQISSKLLYTEAN